jgi:hypothetical protein
MKPHHLILFVLLIISTSLVAQKRAQRPRPVKQVVQNVDDINNNLPFDVVPITINNRDTNNCTSSILLTTTNNDEKDQWPGASCGQFDHQGASSMADRLVHPDFDDSKNDHRQDSESSPDMIIKPEVGDLSTANPPTTREYN